MEDLSVRHREVVAIALHNDHTALTLIMSVDVKDYSSYSRYIHHLKALEVIRGILFDFFGFCILYTRTVGGMDLF